jgi:ABC-type glycerol-3-phosphate transport system substrate-binding protein
MIMASSMARLQRWLVFTLLLLVAGSLSNVRAASTDALWDAAKREGEIVFYASMNLAEANIMIAEFEKRYPSLKVKLNRAGSEKLLTRVLAEARAKRVAADVIQTVEFSMHILKRSGVLARHIAPSDSLYPKNFKDEGFWTTVYYNPTSLPITPGSWRHEWRPKLTPTSSIPSGRER